MAQEIIGFKLQVDGKEKIVSSLGEMKKLLKDANFELLAAQKNFGDYSEEAKAAAKRVAELKDTIQEAKETSDLFDPGKKFQSFAGAASAVAGGFGALQGAMNLVGIESGNVEKALLRVQSAMALSQGLSTIADARKDFERLGSIIKDTSVVQGIYNFVMKGTINGMSLQNAITKATAISTNFFKTAINGVKTASITAAGAMRVLRGIIASLGIGALIYGVTILIDKISGWVGSTGDAKKANEKLNDEIDRQNKLFEKNREALRYAKEDAILQAKIKGASAEELYKISQTYGAKDIELAKKNAADKLKTLKDFEKNNLETVTKNGQVLVRGSEENIEQYKKLKQELEDANKISNDVVRQQNVESQNETLRIAEDVRSKSKALSDKQKADALKDAQERTQAIKDAAQNIRNLEDEIFLQSIKDETQRALVKLSQDKEKEILRIKSSKATAEQKAEELLLIDKKYEQDKTKIETDAATERKEKEKKAAEETIAKLREVIDIEKGIRIAAIQDEGARKRAELQSQKEKEEEDLAKQRADTYFSEEAYQQGLLNIKNKYIKAETDLKKEEAEKQKKIEEEKNNLTIESINKIKDSFTNVVSEFGKNLDYQQQILKQNLDKGLISQEQYNAESEKLAKKKAKQERDLALFSLAIDTGVAIAGIVRLVSKNPMNLTGFAFAADLISRTAIVLTNMAKARNAINQAKLTSSSSSPNMSSGGGGGNTMAPIAPQTTQATLTQLDQSSINRLGSATNRAYVVESDVTNSQERIRRINRAARLN